MAEVVVRHLVDGDVELAGRVEVSSAGTARWHLGQPMDPRARAALDRANLRDPGSLGAYADSAYLDQQDLVLVMTREHRYDVRQRLTNERTDVVLWRDLLDPGKDLDVADPYYGDDAEFDGCLALLRASGPRLTEVLRRRLDEGSFEA